MKGPLPLERNVTNSPGSTFPRSAGSSHGTTLRSSCRKHRRTPLSTKRPEDENRESSVRHGAPTTVYTLSSRRRANLRRAKRASGGEASSIEKVLEGSNEDRIREMLPFSRLLNYRAGEQVVVEGADSRCLYYVESGSVEVSYRVGDTQILVALIGPASLFGEIGFFDGISRVRNIKAAEDSTIRLFDAQSLQTMRERSPLAYGDFVTMMAQSICTKFRRILEEREPLTAYAASLSAGHRSFEEAKPIPQRLLQGEEWRAVSRLVEDFKASFFDLSHKLQQDGGAEVPEALVRQCREVMDSFNERLQEAAELLEKSELADHLWGYAFKEIFPYFMRSRFAERAYYKPSGYAGDFVMMEMIYRNQPDGDGKLGKLVDGWCLETGAARAVRGRRRFLTDQLERLSREKGPKGASVKIMNLACGSNRELFDFLETCSYSQFVTALCIDADQKALEYTDRYINVFPHRASIRLMNDNVVRWALGRIRHNLGLQDIIYSAGLTDYLDDRIFLALINRSYEWLEKGGTLIIGNFGHGNCNKAFLDQILQWRLIHRSEDDFRQIFSRSLFRGNVQVEAEENGINLFAIATKG